MDPATVAIILEAGKIIAVLAPVALQTILKIKALLDTPDTDFEVQIRVYDNGALMSADQSMTLINEWMTSKGFTI